MSTVMPSVKKNKKNNLSPMYEVKKIKNSNRFNHKIAEKYVNEIWKK